METRQVIAVEEEGHGHTAPIERPLTAEYSAGDVAAVLAQLGVASVDVLGFSAGGHTALALAMAHRAMVRRLIIASSFFARDGVIEGFWEGLQNATLKDMPEVYQEADRLLNPDPQHLERLFVLDSQRMPTIPGWSEKELGTISSPTLVLLADRDVIKPEHAVRMTRAIPGSRLLILPGNHETTLVSRPPATVISGQCARRSRSCYAISMRHSRRRVLPGTTGSDLCGLLPQGTS